MSTSTRRLPARERGMALIASLLLLLVITILGVAMFRSYGFQQHIAGNTRDKSFALQNAMAAQRFSEWWLTSSNGVHDTNGTACSGTMNANSGATQVCSNLIQSDVQDVPWPSYIKYTPPNMTGAYQSPVFYISYLGNTATKGYQYNGVTYNMYQIDAAGYGTNPNSVAVVESTYAVQTFKTSEQAPQGQNQAKRNMNLGGP